MRICILEIFPCAIVNIVSELSYNKRKKKTIFVGGKLNKQYVTDLFISKNNAYDLSILNVIYIIRTSKASDFTSKISHI